MTQPSDFSIRHRAALDQLTLGIIDASKAFYEGTIVPETSEVLGQEHRINAAYETAYFLVHMANREMLNALPSVESREAAQNFVHGKIAEIWTNSFCKAWPEEMKAQIQIEFLENLEDADRDDGECTDFFPQKLTLNNNNYLIVRFARRVADYILQLQNPLTAQLSKTVVCKNQNFGLDAWDTARSHPRCSGDLRRS